MNYNKEKISDNEIKFIVTIDNKSFLDTENEVFNKKKNRFQIDGFRKGHVDKNLVFKYYGRGVLFDDVANELINKSLSEIVKNDDEKIISRPDVSVTDLGPDKDFVYEAIFGIVPIFKVANYKGVKVDKIESKFDESRVDKILEDERFKNSRLQSVERSAKDKDVVNINFEGFVDNVPFEGGKAEKFDLTLGSKSFIDNFEDQIIGHNVNDEFDVNVTFPDDYQAPNLKGKKAVFKVKINEIKERILPELNDEFISEISEFEKLDDYKNDLRNRLKEQAEKIAEDQMTAKIVDEINDKTNINLSKLSEEYAVENYIDDVNNRLRRNGMDLDSYLKYINKSYEDFEKECRDVAIKNLKRTLVLEEIGKLENIEVSEEAVDKEIENMAKAYGMELKRFKDAYANENDRKELKKNLYIPEVLKFIFKNASVK